MVIIANNSAIKRQQLCYSLFDKLLCPADGYLDLVTQAMPSASPSEVSTRPGFGRMEKLFE